MGDAKTIEYRNLTEFEKLVGEACKDAMSQMPTANPALWAIERQWTRKLFEAARKELLEA